MYFRREVLNKYYADADRFTVEDGFLRCAGLWGLRVDNDQAGHIMVFLGDLERDIPRPRRSTGGASTSRAFAGQFADPQSADLRFPHAYCRVNETWQATFGEPLFQPLHEDDRHALRAAARARQRRYGGVRRAGADLAKLLVDSLNEGMLTAKTGKRPKGEKGLAKLERFLTELDMPDARALLEPLADVQGLRSRGAAHRKGSTFDIRVAIGELGRQKGFEKLLDASISTLDARRSTLDARRSTLDARRAPRGRGAVCEELEPLTK